MGEGLCKMQFCARHCDQCGRRPRLRSARLVSASSAVFFSHNKSAGSISTQYFPLTINLSAKSVPACRTEPYFRKAQALMLLKDYEKACNTLAEALEVDPLNDEADKLYWEAMELKNGGTQAA